ncbi:MAG: NblA/ycf18 family protein [Microcoleaceae cyanobacterium]
MSGQLSLEQQFELRAFEQKIQDLDEAGAKQLLVTLYRSKMVQGNTLQSILRDAWGIDKDIREVLEI